MLDIWTCLHERLSREVWTFGHLHHFLNVNGILRETGSEQFNYFPPFNPFITVLVAMM